jgi:integrase/recombinase XerC
MIKHLKQWQQNLSNRNRSKNTIKAYLQDFHDFAKFYAEYKNEILTLENFKTISPQEIRAWLMHQRMERKNPRSSVRAIASMRNFAQFLLQNETITEHAFFHTRSPKIAKTLPRPVTIEQALQITSSIENLSKETWVGLRNKALMMLLYSAGLRISEALQLNQDILSQTDFITVKGKGNKVRQVPILEPVKAALVEYIKKQPFTLFVNEPLFYGEKGKRLQAAIAQKELRDFRRMYNLPESVTPHALRHSCATHIMQSSNDLRGLQELLGHASLSSTQIYTQIDETGLMKNYNAFHPRAKKY